MTVEKPTTPSGIHSPASEPNAKSIPRFPFASTPDFLELIGTFQGHPDFEGAVVMESVSEWLCLELQKFTGLDDLELSMAMRRLARGQSLSGVPQDPALGAYGKGCPDLRHIITKLRQLDMDGSIQIVWQKLCQKWPFFAEATRESKPQTVASTTSPGQVEQTSYLARALAFIMDRNKATGIVPKMKDIALAAGVDRSTLYRCPQFKNAIKALRARALPKGHKDSTGKIEAYDGEE